MIITSGIVAGPHRVHDYVAGGSAHHPALVEDAGSVASDQHRGSSYVDQMKRITVSLPDDLVDSLRRAAGGDGQVSSYVATALAAYQEQDHLDEILASWQAETPIPDRVRRRVAAELDEAGLHTPAEPGGQVTG